MKSAIGYTRVSTDKQVNGGVSLEEQEARIREYCDRHNLTLIDVVSDPGESGSSLLARPEALRSIRWTCRTGGTLIIYELNRLFRNLREAVNIHDRIERTGGTLVGATENLDTSTLDGWTSFILKAFMAEVYIRQLRQRTRNAMRFKRERGDRVGRHATFGYRVSQVGRTVTRKDREVTIYPQEPDPAEQAAIAEMVRLRRLRFSPLAISRKLFEAGHKSRAGKAISAKTIRKILSRKAVK